MCSELKNLIVLALLTAAGYLVIAAGLACMVGEYQIFLFGQIAVYPALIVCAVLFFELSRMNGERTFVVRAFGVALAVRFAAVAALYYLLMKFQGHPYLSGYKDEYTYHVISDYFANNAWATISDVKLFGLSDNYGAYPYLVSFFYRWFGAHTLVARFLNAFLGALCVIPLYLFVKHIGGKQETAKLAVSLYAFSANFILFDSLQYKDSLLMLLCFSLLSLGSMIRTANRIWQTTLITLLYFGVNFLFLFIRGQFFFLFTVFFLIFAFTRSPGRMPRAVSRTVLFALLAAGVILVARGEIAHVSARFGQFSGDFLEHQFFRYEKWRVSDYLGPLIPFIIAATGAFLPLVTLVRLPHPDLKYSVDMFTIPASFEIFFTSAIAFLVVCTTLKAERSDFKTVYVFAVIFYLSLVTTGYVTDPRHKLLFTAFSLIVMAYGIAEKGLRLRKAMSVCMAGVSVVFLYNLIRMLARGHL